MIDMNFVPWNFEALENLKVPTSRLCSLSFSPPWHHQCVSAILVQDKAIIRMVFSLGINGNVNCLSRLKIERIFFPLLSPHHNLPQANLSSKLLPIPWLSSSTSSLEQVLNLIFNQN